MVNAAWLICAFPLAGFVSLLVLGRRLGEPRAGWLATIAMAGSFLTSLLVFIALIVRDSTERQVVVTLFQWIPAGDFSVDAGLLVDPLSVTMALFITGVGALIHLYAIAYMHGDGDYSKFFLYLNLFAFSMLVLVLGDNLALTFLGWEGVGLCSYLLISFWFTDEANATAGKKAFVTNRVGDWGFMLAIFLAFSSIGSIRYLDLGGNAQLMSSATATAITVLLFVGAAGKSAQIPLYIWLPDAMAGPTPVSALIHAATMVTAGVFVLVRANPVLEAADAWAPSVIAWVGVATALFAATIAVAQNDIKKVLAYSTISQLGYMMLAVGTGAYVAAIFHMITHAFFKALLFLGSGSVIHALDGDQDMRRYGGLRPLMPVTAITFIVGWLAIAGVPPLSGFWSKDEILAFAWDSSPYLWALGLTTAVLTAFYMSRQVLMTFFGSPRYAPDAVTHDFAIPAAPAAYDTAVPAAADPGPTAPTHSEPMTAADAAHTPDTVIVASQSHANATSDMVVVTPPDPTPHPHDPSRLMTVPLIVLAGAAAVAGLINLPFQSNLHFLGGWLEPSLFGNEAHTTISTATKWLLAVISIGAALFGIIMALAIHLRDQLTARFVAWPAAARGWYVDEAVTRFVGGPGRWAFNLLAAFDTHIVDGAVNGIGRTVRAAGNQLRHLQTGLVRFYALLTAIGAVALLVWFLSRVTV